MILAFPVDVDDGSGRVVERGMTLRDYFAAKAMQSMLLDEGYANRDWPHNLSEDAYKVADAMMLGRENEPAHNPRKDDELNAGQRAADACRKALALIERCKLDADHPKCIGTFEVVEEIEKLAKAVVVEEDA